MNLQEQTNRIKSIMGVSENTSAHQIMDIYNDWSGFNSREEAIEELDYLLNTDFPHGLNNIPENVTLYRVLALDNNETINEDEIGEHFVAEPQICYTRSFLEKIGIWDYIDNVNLFILTCKTNKDNINMNTTIGNRLLYPRENEFTIDNPKNVKLISRKQIKLADID